ncbi:MULTISPECIES: porin [Shewanella]|jgi:predicted porin|uniref:porin n=1 Tax=Shewanella TaxID=22 RepID=UPI001676F9BB|nr:MULTISPECIES: porin [Shewanella]MBO1270392.1 porin [Shewanella sp. 4t3-1-2LB]MCL2908131.1 porin [Shewanella fodinae]
MMNAFCKTLLASAIAAASVASAHAADPLTVYGKLNVTVQNNDENGKDSVTSVQSNASRFGVKGDYDLGNSLSAFYTVEYEVATDSSSSNNFNARNQFVGLKGNFGAISVGRNDTMLKNSQGGVDQFNDLSGDLKSLFKGDNRMAQTVTYLSPSMGDFRFGATYAADADSAQAGDNGFSSALMYGDASLKKTPIYAAIAYDSKVKGYDVLRASVQAKLGDFKLGGMYQTQEKSEGDNDSTNGYLVSAAYDIKEVTLKAQYQDMEDTGDSWSVGADYKLAKPTKLFAFYTSRSMDNEADDDKYFGVGLEHKF